MDYLLSREFYQAVCLYRAHELWSILDSCIKLTTIAKELAYELDVDCTTEVFNLSGLHRNEKSKCKEPYLREGFFLKLYTIVT